MANTNYEYLNQNQLSFICIFQSLEESRLIFSFIFFSNQWSMINLIITWVSGGISFWNIFIFLWMIKNHPPIYSQLYRRMPNAQRPQKSSQPQVQMIKFLMVNHLPSNPLNEFMTFIFISFLNFLFFLLLWRMPL